MKYYSNEGECYSIEVAGQSTNGTHYAVVVADIEGKESTLISIESTVNKIEIEQKLADYAKENNLVPELIWKIKKGERVLQGKPIVTNDFIKVTDEVVADAFRHYIAAKNRITALEAEKKNKIEEVKKDYAEQMEAEEETMNSIESVVRTGTKKEECEASWERDINNGVMVLIRIDTLKPLQWRPMNEQELQLCTDDPETNPEQTEEQ